VRSALSSTRFVPFTILLAGLTPVLTGCGNDNGVYPAELTYPLRSDPIVVEVPSETPFSPTGPGQFEANINRFGPAGSGGIGGKIVHPQDIQSKDRQDLDKALLTAFGKPAKPAVTVTDKSADEQISALKLDDKTLAEGSSLYRRHCLHCHGVDGDGRGPTGPWVSPHPRDYREGVFKFVSTDPRKVSGRKPRRQDLHRTLEHGIEGTSMPSFGLFTDAELEALISYVIHLSIRGETERVVMESLIVNKGREGLGTDDINEYIQSTVLKALLARWYQSNGEVLEPPAYPYKAEDKEQLAASIRRGYDLFTDPQGQASCIQCHLDFGRQVPFRYDKWGTLVRPANLTMGVYRGGRRPIDIYWRITGGIDGANMPAATFTSKDKNVEASWDIVNFVQALPYPQMLPSDIRDKIYPRPQTTESKHASR
jgi:mono/diheme cytochrome c family protein